MCILTHIRLKYKPYKLNLSNPKTFNEHLNYKKLKENYPLGTIVADKVKVRTYIKEKIGEKYLIPIHGIYSSADEVNFKELPKGFALKTNHGSGWNVICQDKEKLDIQATKNKFSKWLKYNAYYLSREWQYKDIQPLIICEKLLKYEIFDYKFFCFKGQPIFIQVDIDRFTNHTRNFYDLEWNLQGFGINYPLFNKKIEKPAQLQEMIEVSKVLSKDFDFVRVDLYVYENKVFFGELTLYPGGGFEPFLSIEQDLEMGEYFSKN
ncbi:MAG: hypothetical protein H6604_00980 [Flavobacteriales bacterium]|nr:hypothetical protein [Flavobacteriales bacterium]